MKTRRWDHPLTQANVSRLVGLGHHFVGPDHGSLACGETGRGKLAPVEEIDEAVRRILTPGVEWQGKKVLITAGPTREPWDPIRFLSNRSSGKMGYALAAAARLRGACVTLVSGPVALDCPAGVQRIPVTTALDMHAQTLKYYPDADVAIATAAVADFRPVKALDEKLKKNSGPVHLDLVANPDILLEMGQQKTKQILVGFAAETSDLARAAMAKRAAKNCDLMIANLAEAFEADHSQVLIVDRNDGVETLPRLSKTEAAGLILDRIAVLFRPGKET
jgi:phosphopantothenoylcysteine decarboxylase/phosphopantothenate--cysteine ligase